ncbi:hypothetical protein HJG60_008228 [Phyllostomus discolor]|uniref:Uncharacterized protein n=1 Tax=Phyllostomus discolor TaxID=89673 RepID=A0A834DSK1_9CHIR|nr:hypothetical protein HJG60_008228 [Phyllostomus discolor]
MSRQVCPKEKWPLPTTLRLLRRDQNNNGSKGGLFRACEPSKCDYQVMNHGYLQYLTAEIIERKIERNISTVECFLTLDVQGCKHSSIGKIIEKTATKGGELALNGRTGALRLVRSERPETLKTFDYFFIS